MFIQSTCKILPKSSLRSRICIRSIALKTSSNPIYSTHLSLPLMSPWNSSMASPFVTLFLNWPSVGAQPSNTKMFPIFCTLTTQKFSGIIYVRRKKKAILRNRIQMLLPTMPAQSSVSSPVDTIYRFKMRNSFRWLEGLLVRRGPIWRKLFKVRLTKQMMGKQMWTPISCWNWDWGEKGQDTRKDLSS